MPACLVTAGIPLARLSADDAQGMLTEYRSGTHWTACGFTFSTPRCGWCRRAWSASCTWRALVSHADMLTGPDSPPRGSPRIPSARRDAEILILRHQVAAIQRQVRNPRLLWADRAVLAVPARLLPGSQLRQLRLLISRRTLLRWRADLVRRHWAHPRRAPGGPGGVEGVPARPGEDDPRDRFPSCRHLVPAPPVRTVLHRARHPPRAPGRDHRPSHRGAAPASGP
jgi:hypothetical protein